MNKLPEQYTIDLFNFVRDAQQVSAGLNQLYYSEENRYLTGIEIAAIGLIFAMGKESIANKDEKYKETLMKDVASRLQEWDQKLSEMEAAHEKGTCGCSDHACDDEGDEPLLH